jgi:hypothetical protein
MIEHEVLIRKYSVEKLSMKQISLDLECSVHKVEYWMNKHSIKRRSISDAIYIKQNKNGDPFNIKSSLNSKEKLLKGLGLGIYWGEGNKKNTYSVRVGNTDPELLRVFVLFLRKICGVHEHKIRYGLQLFTDVEEQVALNFWQEQLGIDRSKIMPTVNRIVSGKIGTYKTKNEYGVITVYVNNRKLRDWMVAQLKSP